MTLWAQAQQGKISIHGRGKQFARHTLNNIAGGLSGGGETSSSNRRYYFQITSIGDISNKEGEDETKMSEAEITLFDEEAIAIHPDNDNPMAITVRCDDLEIKRVFVDQWSSIDNLYSDAFERLILNPYDLKIFKGSLAWFSREQV